MRIPTIGSAALVAAFATAGVSGALAQSSLNAPPLAADKVSGSDKAGDPNGAIRSLDNTAADKPDHTRVKVPALGGHDVRPGGAPAGTSTR